MQNLIEISFKYRGYLDRIYSPLTYIFSLFLWVGCSLVYLETIPRQWWIFRDDSVIHLSQAKNLALFGIIGLSAGERIESMSSPLNFFISMIVYFAKPDLSYQTYLTLFLIISLAALSISINFAFHSGLKCKNYKSIKIISLNFLLFFLILSSWTTFGWIISGMENVLTIILLVLLIGAATGEKEHIILMLVSISLLGVSRVELAAFVFPILVLLALKINVSIGKRYLLFLIPISIWLLVHSIRFWYFGHLLPNTATALGKNFPIHSMLFILLEYVIIFLGIVGRTKNILSKNFASQLALLLFAFIGIWKIVTSNFTFLYQTVLIVCFCIILIVVFYLVSKSHLTLQTQLLCLIVLIPLNHFFLFGPARLSAFRIVSAYVLPILLFILILIQQKLFLHRNILSKVLLFFLSILAPLIINAFDHQRNLCCSISPSDVFINKQAKDLFPEKSGLAPLPIVANPDLGKMSFSKKVMNVDLGLIGEPILAKLMRNSPELVDDYLTDFAAPDILELHGHWHCVYSILETNERFKSEWEIAWTGFVSEEMSPTLMPECPRNGQYTIWKRLIPEKERNLSSVIASESFSDYSVKINQEIVSCSTSVVGCQYITRSIIRNRALLIKENKLVATTNLLRNSPSYELDYLRLLQPRNWDEGAYAALVTLINSPKGIQ